MPSNYASMSRSELARLVPELLLIGHLIDRSGMPWCISSFGRDAMVQIAIEEWASASPIYSKRMQRALGFEGDDVLTIFKNLQLDIGAPPQFMDFRFALRDRWYGEFWLDHCGALMDVEPMGEDFVVGMCHTIEDPTFDATAAATNPRARMRPIHRPPRISPDKRPHCAWIVSIDDDNEPLPPHPGVAELAKSILATWQLDTIDPTDDGEDGYSGPMVSDIDFQAFSHAALVRLADEICVQMHLLTLGFQRAVARFAASDEQARDLVTRQLIGHAGLAAERLRRLTDVAPTPAGAVNVLRLHPLFNPLGYVDATIDGEVVSVAPSPAHDDNAWLAHCGPHSPEPLRAIVQGVNPHLDVEIQGSETEWSLVILERDAPSPERDEVAVTRFSTGTNFSFEPRKSIPLTVL